MPYTADELVDILGALLAGSENEVVEFKEAKHQFSADKTGAYVAALSNEANLRRMPSAWLVFGLSDSKEPVGTTHLQEVGERNKLKSYIQQSTDPSLTVREIHEVLYRGKRLLLLEVPAAPRGVPISWKGDYRARAGESLVPLSLDKLDEIRAQSAATDWTAQTVPNATIDHLDPEALRRARQGFSERHPELAEDLAGWSEETFLSKIRLVVDGQLTRAAILLLGKPTSTHLLSPHLAELTWKLTGEESAYEHFGLPFLLSASSLAARIRNVKLRLLPPDELIYREIPKYDNRSILEAIYNCIAHQDYEAMARVIVIERPTRIEFISTGDFFDGQPEDYMLGNCVPSRYRNPALVTAMTELNLIDHMGNGIHRIVQDQVRRFLPLPDYDLQRKGEVKLTIHGAVIDQAYSQQLMGRTGLELRDVLALDHVQKRLPISTEAVTRLRQAKLIEGRQPNLRVAESVAAATDELAHYVRTRPQTDAHYATLVLDFLGKKESATRAEIDELLLPLLPEVLTPVQKQNKVGNLLSKLRREAKIRNAGSRPQPKWVLS